MIGLTPRQLDLLRFIRGYQIARGGVSPSVRECQRGLGLASTQSIQRMMVCLEERGAMRRRRNWARAIEVLVPVPFPSINGQPLYAVPMIASGSTRFSGERL